MTTAYLAAMFGVAAFVFLVVAVCLFVDEPFDQIEARLKELRATLQEPSHED